MKINITNKEGLEFLKEIDTNSVDLILTDPPYITSQDSGMDRWVKHVEKQNKPDSTNVKTEEDWAKYVFNKDWQKFFENSNVVDKNEVISYKPFLMSEINGHVWGVKDGKFKYKV